MSWSPSRSARIAFAMPCHLPSGKKPLSLMTSARTFSGVLAGPAQADERAPVVGHERDRGDRPCSSTNASSDATWSSHVPVESPERRVAVARGSPGRRRASLRRRSPAAPAPTCTTCSASRGGGAPPAPPRHRLRGTSCGRRVPRDDRREVACRRAASRSCGPRRRRGARRRRHRRPRGGAGRTSSEPWSASARRSTTPAARISSRSRSANSSRRRATCASRRASAPAASSTSARNASSASGSRASARSTSSAMTLPEPSQIEAQRRLAVEARHARLLDEAVAAEDLERLEGVVGARLQTRYLPIAVARRLICASSGRRRSRS